MVMSKTDILWVPKQERSRHPIHLPSPIAEIEKPRVKEWLQGIADSEFVITDSFHGKVFSIIFEKLFFAVGNLERGLTRFQSLLHALNLDERLCRNRSM